MGAMTGVSNREPAPSVGAEDYVLLAPGGQFLKVNAAVFDALSMFMGIDRKYDSGNLEIQCRNGGVAGVEVNVKLK